MDEILCPVCKSDLRETLTEDETIANSVRLDGSGDGITHDYEAGDGEFSGEFYCDWCDTLLIGDEEEVVKILKGERVLTLDDVIEYNGGTDEVRQAILNKSKNFNLN